MRARLLVAGLLLAVGTVTPAASAKGSFPSCAKLSRKAMATIAQTGPLELRKKIGNLCEFTGDRGKHQYQPTFEVQLIPYISRIWNTAEGSAQFTAAKNGSVFGHANKNLFDVSGAVTDSGLQPCMPDLGSPGQGESLQGPVCSPEPPEDHFSAYGRGIDKRNGLHIMVSAGLTGQQGDVHLSHLLELVKEIFSGKIH
jgi:hypothetical protein